MRQIITDKSWGIVDRFYPSNIYVFCPTIRLDEQYTQFEQSLIERSKLKKNEDHQFDSSS
jgi:hypothetical protein